MDDVAQLDTPIQRANISQLPVETLDKWLAVIRDRRLAIVQRIQNLEGEKHERRLDELAARYMREYARVQSAMTKIEAALAAVEPRITKLRVLEIELS